MSCVHSLEAAGGVPSDLASGNDVSWSTGVVPCWPVPPCRYTTQTNHNLRPDRHDRPNGHFGPSANSAVGATSCLLPPRSRKLLLPVCHQAVHVHLAHAWNACGHASLHDMFADRVALPYRQARRVRKVWASASPETNVEEGKGPKTRSAVAWGTASSPGGTTHTFIANSGITPTGALTPGRPCCVLP